MGSRNSTYGITSVLGKSTITLFHFDLPLGNIWQQSKCRGWGEKRDICPNPRAVNGRCFMITCLQSRTETSSSLILRLILTLSYRLRISGRESHVSRRKTPSMDSKTRTQSHTGKKRRPQRGHSAELAPPARHTSSPFLHAGSTAEVPAAPLGTGGTAGFQHTQQGSEETHRWEEVNAGEGGVREGWQIPRCSCPSWWSFGTKFVLAPSVLRPTGRMFGKRWLLMWR